MTSRPADGLAQGAILGHRYVVLDEIGRGSQSIVYSARDTSLAIEVAVKLLSPPPGRAREARERLRRDVEMVRALRHPNVVGVHDYLEDGNAVFLVMTLVRGQNLARRLGRQGPLAPAEAAWIGNQIGSALGAAHAQGILHRDVKPANVLLDGNDLARLGDFGSARLEGGATVTAPGALVGTLAYAAPEVLAGQRGDARSDIYALGMTLYEALVGQLPDHPRHLPPPPAALGHHPRHARPEVPGWLDDVIARATSAAPQDRFATADLVATALATGDQDEAFAPGPAAALGAPCMVCGAATVPGSPLCRTCDPDPGRGGDRYLFVESPGAEFYPVIAELIASDPGLSEAAGLDEAAAGRRPLMRLPFSRAEALSQWLADRKVYTAPVGAAAIWRAIPRSFYLLVASILAVGSVAGIMGSAHFLWASPAVALLLAAGAFLEVRRPAVDAAGDRDTVTLPAAITDQLAALPPGPARDLLADVVRLARELISRESGLRTRSRIAGELEPLGEAAAGAAGELAALDRQLDRLRAESAGGVPLPEGWWAAVTATEQARDRLAQSLLELIAALGTARTESALAFTAPGALIGELTREFGERIEQRRTGRLEVSGAPAGPAPTAY